MDISFFSSIAEELVSQLRNEKEKSVAASWLQKLREVHDDNLRLRYVKLFILSLQKSILTGVLAQPPPADPHEVIKILEQIFQNFSSSKKSENSRETGKISTSVSGDLREYFALQEVDETLVHGCYGISGDGPIFKNPIDSNLTLIPSEENRTDVDDHPEETPTDVEKCHCRKSHEVSNWRPCWGRNRYIERLIDQSPHTSGDLEAIEVNAVLSKFHRRQKSTKSVI